MREFVEAQARKALEQLRSEGWAVGPPAEREAWRAAVRREARTVGLRIRTGEAVDSTHRSDHEPRPWAVTVERHEALRVELGGVDLATVGTMVVSADAGRRLARKAP